MHSNLALNPDKMDLQEVKMVKVLAGLCERCNAPSSAAAAATDITPSLIDSWEHPEGFRYDLYMFEHQKNPSETIEVYIFTASSILEDTRILPNLYAFYENASLHIEDSLRSKLTSSKPKVFTGFSIAGGLAHIAACYYQHSSVAFESPGMKNILSKFSHTRAEYTSFECADITTFLTVPNEVNTFGEHVGNIRRIYIKHVAKTSYWHVGKAALGAVSGAMTIFSLGSSLYARTAGDAILNASSNISYWNQALKSSTRALSKAEKILTNEKMAQTYGGLFNSHIIKFAEQTLERTSKINSINIENLSRAQDVLSTCKKTLETTTKIARIATGITVVTAAPASLVAARAISLQPKKAMDEKAIKKLVEEKQHNLARIINALSNNDTTLVKIKGQEGYIFTMEGWPTTLSQSWGTTASNFGRSFIPFLRSNPGIRNLNDENDYIEANIEVMDGYKLKP